MKIYDDIGIQIPQIYLPRKGTNLTKWAVIACDQFTSEPEYWQEVEKLVGKAPSTYNLVLPEVFLEKPGEARLIQSIQATMREYLDKGILQPRHGLIYVERTALGKTRRGLVLCLDLERYDFTKGSTSLIRATEGTIVERLPPRMKIRTGAVLELPHILVLIDDPQRTVIEPVEKARGGLEKVYDFDLMLGSGHLTGYAVSEALEAQVVTSLRGLAKPEVFAAKYGLSQDKPVLLFAMGDGNHSLATAKAVWERMKPEVGLDHPARYALIELENVHDEGLEFEPIHRVLFGLKRDIFAALKGYFDANFTYTPVASAEEMIRRVDNAKGPKQAIGLVGGGRDFGILEIANPSSNLPVGTLQAFLDPFINEGGADNIDYVHGGEIVCKLGAQPGNAGFYAPGMDKSDLFKTVILDGAFPRKTFSMGEAKEKRFYMEARKIA
ncbi:MAG: DUF1015 domain-containing protein [Candidatus Atribacteria bacterium]|nr:DUF1015 domain-containing protein [Candidatus Atribacteria bacterium]